MAAGQGFKTFATGDVLTAADTNGYLMQGIWVFANATARDAAVTSPQEGNACYLKDTDAVQTYSGSAWVAVGSGGLSSPLTTKGDVWGYSTTNARVPVGTNGQFLTADSTNANGVAWTTPSASASGMTKIAASTFSAITSLNIDSLFSSTYKSYMLTLNCNSSASGILNMQMRYGTTTVTSADYYGSGFSIDRSTVTSTWCASGTSTRAIVPDLSGTATITMYFNRVGNSSQGASWFVTGTWGGQQLSGHGSGYVDVNQTYTGIALATSTGNITGNYQVYGLAI
jgi:hypothetical protein